MRETIADLERRRDLLKEIKELESGAPGDFAGLTVDEIVAKAKAELGDEAAAMLRAIMGKA
jgi:hypothetical protein